MNRYLSLVLASALMLGSVPSYGQEGGEDDPEVIKMAKEHYKLGLEAYKSGKFDVAIKELKRAYLLKRLPPLLLNIAATYRKLGDNQMSLHFYKKYLDEAPPDAKDRNDVERTIVEITDGKAPEAAPAKPAAVTAEPTTTNAPQDAPPPAVKDEPAPAPRKVEWNHNVIDAVPPEQPVDVRVTMPVLKGVKVFVFYRVSGEADFRPVLMKRHGGEKIGRIPADAIQGTSLQYYIEGRDSGGNIVKTIGSEASPNIIMVDASAPVQMVAGYQEPRNVEEAPQEPVERQEEDEVPRGQKHRRDLDDEAAPVSGDAPRRRAEKSSSGGGHTLTVAGAVLLGVGVAGAAVGIAGHTLAHQYSSALTTDSHNPIDGEGNMILFNNDPNASVQAATYESRGKMWNSVGIAGCVAGGALAVVGVALIGVDASRHSSGNDTKKPRRRRPTQEESFYLVPSASPTFAGVQSGFAF